MTLPEELLQRIFQTYLHMLGQTSTKRDVIKYSEARLYAPFFLASICRGWRAHALASPLLWTYIVVPALMWDPTSNGYIWGPPRGLKKALNRVKKRWLKHIQLLLTRSGQAGLDIVIPIVSVPFLWPDVRKAFGVQRQAVMMLAPHRARIRSLHMSPRGWISPLIWDIIGNCHVGTDGTLNIVAPSLEVLELKMYVSDLDRPRSPAVHIDAPLLRTCLIKGSTCLRPQLSPLVQLQATISYSTWDTWTRTLAFCATTLEDLDLRVLHPPDYSTQALGHLTPITFPRLVHFAITPAYEVQKLLAELFAIISAPVLRSARFTGTRRDPPTAPAFIQFIQFLDTPSNGTIEELAIRYAKENGILDVEDARLIVQHLSSVKAIKLLSHCDIAVGFLGVMHHLVPHIQIHIESAYVWLPIGSPQEQLTVAVETPDPDNGTMAEKRFAFFDVSRVDRDYSTIFKTENIYNDQQCVVQAIFDAIVVWRAWLVVGGGDSEEQYFGSNYQILPSKLGRSSDSLGGGPYAIFD